MNPNCLTFSFVLSAAMTVAAGGQVIDSMDTLSFRPPKDKEKGQVELVEGKFGKAIRFTFADDCKSVFAFGRGGANEAWEQADGFSFWVKGDGSKHFGCLQIVWNDNYSVRYDYAFPLASTEWKKVVVPWRELTPVLPKPEARFLGTPEGNSPGKLGAIWFGKWWYWRDAAGHSYAIDQIQLEPKIERDTRTFQPQGDPLARVRRKLQAGEPITVVTMGDSLTDFRHWANRKTNWPTLLAEAIEKSFKSKVTIVNPAVGGTELRQNLVRIPTWTAHTPEPDLVTVCFGFNDYNSGMRETMFETTVKVAIDRIRRATGGKSDVLILTTCPAFKHWDTFAGLAAGARRAAQQKNAGLADLYAAFHRVPAEQRQALFARDHTHLGEPGHRLVMQTVLQQINPD